MFMIHFHNLLTDKDVITCLPSWLSLPSSVVNAGKVRPPAVIARRADVQYMAKRHSRRIRGSSRIRPPSTDNGRSCCHGTGSDNWTRRCQLADRLDRGVGSHDRIATGPQAVGLRIGEGGSTKVTPQHTQDTALARRNRAAIQVAITRSHARYHRSSWKPAGT